MAETKRFALTPQLDIEQILLEAQNRWLRPAEICEILRNYRKFRIAPEPPNKPPSGSLFLFDRKVLRYFRKDGHNWRKKKDGKTVKEAHERLKAGSVDVLHCYYAHGEENENFQRRSYWMLEEDFMHIVLVHYREVKGSKASFARTTDVEEISQGVHLPVCSSSLATSSQVPSQSTDAESSNSAQTSELEDAESDNYEGSSRYNSFLELQQSMGRPVMDASLLDPSFPDPSLFSESYYPGPGFETDYFSVAQEDIMKFFDETGVGFTLNRPQTQINLTSWDEVMQHCTAELPGSTYPLISSTQRADMEDTTKHEPFIPGESLTGELGMKPEDGASTQDETGWQLANSKVDSAVTSNLDLEIAPANEGNLKYSALLKQLSLDISNTDGEGGLKKYDSFSRWMSKELGEVDDSHIQSNSRAYWNTVESESMVEESGISNHEDTYLLSPSLSQDQLFSIIDFSPSWTYMGLETKVLITGKFLKDKKDISKCKWSCMFGEVEVPAEVLADGILCCHTPPYKPGRVPFYVTCSDRVACSEVREFEYRVSQHQYVKTSRSYSGHTSEIQRLGELLSIRSDDHAKPVSSIACEKLHLISEVNSLLRESDDGWSNIFKITSNNEFFPDEPKDQLLQRLLKEKLHAWLLHKIVEDGKGPSVLDKDGQGVLHLAASLGYDWVIAPTVAAGVNINFRDVHGWAALHWAASCGRERTVVALLSLGADPGALTDPTPEFPSGKTPADLASDNGHKGIAGFLAESSLASHLSALTIKESGVSVVMEASSTQAVEDIARRTATQPSDGDTQAVLSLKDSLSAVRNASLAAARIHQVFRVHSFHRKKLTEYGDDKFGMSEERALSLLSVKTNKSGQHDEPVAAAIKIQNKFRGWKGRKEFLVIRQRIVKIQAHVRGHQVRKHYRKVVWSVGIVEKAILRWRRKGSGLRGFRSEGLLEGSTMQDQPSKVDDYDFLQEGRKQTEARLEKALARVKSMVQYPEARDQYRRLLTVNGEFQESKALLERVLDDSETAEGDMMFDLEELLGDDTHMSTG